MIFEDIMEYHLSE